ncbi:hypothetical protein [Paenibacillus sp. P22]|uniref:hypothetical protein n=1 Tax=Paenibacillus sp. P22 TaxID=483908 RepID=UPI0003901922|nr:hypothetical protein [Paenibacillus sp. P22]CDN44180.1 hypothetical protein BN871_EI_00090 [Paenibacillus sp. P22]
MGDKRIEKIPVYFSQDDPDQVALFKWVQTKKNRSGYLKRLIQRDMDASSPQVGTSPLLVSTTSLNSPMSANLSFDAAGFI